jgi:translation initiation factor 3 subunit K
MATKTAIELRAEEIAVTNQGIDRYNPNNIFELKDYLDLQIKENKYDKEANLSLLKLIQLSLESDEVETAHCYMNQDHSITPEQIQANFDSTWKIYGDTVFKVLIKGLMQMPRNENFTLMKSMINIEHHQQELIGWSFMMYDLLDCCHFEKFWKEISAVPERVENFTGFYDSIRAYVCYAISKTFQNVSITLAMKYLGITDKTELKQWADRMNWQIKETEIYCGNLEDRVKTKKITETINLKSVGMSDVLGCGVTYRGLKNKPRNGRYQ